MQKNRYTFFSRYALYVLMVVFFIVPFALRGARLTLEQMKNEVSDWLPREFDETRELAWFRDNFLGEQFVLVSWDGCTDEDQRLAIFAKLLSSNNPDGSEDPALEKDREFADEHGLFVQSELNEDGKLRPVYHENWGGENEKWFRGHGDKWFYIKEDGKLYEWAGNNTVPENASRGIERWYSGKNKLEGKEVALVDPSFYKHPRRLQARLFKTVVTGPDILAKLTADDGSLMVGLDPNNPLDVAHVKQQAHDRLRGVLFGPDDKQTCLVATLSPAGKKDLRRTLGRGILGKPMGKLHELADQAGIKSEDLRLGGPPVDNVAIDEEGEKTLANLVVFSLAVGVGLSYVCLRSVKLTIMVFFVGGVSAVTSMSLVWWLGSTADAVMMSMPAVVYVLGLSGAIHVVNYYRDAVEEDGVEGAPEKAVSHGWYPCTIAAITTAVGLGSLCTSNIIPIKKFGFFSALGVIATLFLLFTYLPAALEMWAPKPRKKKAVDNGPSPFRQWIGQIGDRFANVVVARNVSVAITCFIGFIFFAYGLTFINTSVQLLNMFDNNSRIIKDYHWLENNMGKLVPMELVIRVQPDALRPTVDELELAAEAPGAVELSDVDPKFQLSFLDRMDIARRVQQVVESELGPEGEDKVGYGMSTLTFAPELPEAGGRTDSFAVRSKTNRELEKHRSEFLDTDFLRIDTQDDAELWRISLRVGALQDVDYGEFVYDLKELAEPVIAAYKYRDQILKKIDADRNGSGFAASRVAMIGANFAQFDGKEAKPAEANVATDRATEIFASTLRDLLMNARVKVYDFDPETHSEDRFKVLLEGTRKFAKADYAIVLEDVKFDKSTLDSLGTHVFECKNYAYDATRASIDSEEVPAVSIVYTGVVPIVYKAANTLLGSLIESTIWAFALIAVVMTFVLKSLRAGLVSMIPNVFPVVAVFGFMGWRGIEVDIGTMMTASVAMGVAVDDTVHFLTWFRWGLDKGLERAEAIKEAYRRCALAMMQTTLIGGLGLAIFAFSSFTPTQRFGYLMISLLAAALVGDLIFLPALLAGPLGKVFKADKKSGSNDQPTDESSSDLESADGDEEPDIIPVTIGTMKNNTSSEDGGPAAKGSKYTSGG